jgi:succinate dehydrogenase/fumarate reductase flavoprotein subunit
MTSPPVPTEVDVLVLGSGMAGSTAALVASRAGARTLLVEKSATFGGSAALSAGFYWSAPDVEALRRRVPLGDPEIGTVLIEEFYPTLEVIRSTGVHVSDDQLTAIMTYGIGYSFDVRGYLAAARDEIVRRGGVVVSGVRARSLVCEGDAVSGVRFRNGSGECRSRATVLATGGFQGDREMVHRYVGANGDRLLRRTNPGSVGDGLRLGRDAGAARTGGMSTFYGHLIAHPVRRFLPEDYLPYSQYYSGHTLILNRRGERFIDETLGDELINQTLALQPEARATLVFDETIRSTEARKEPFPGTGLVDRLQVAVDAGGRYATAATLNELLDATEAWGYDRDRARETVDAYDYAVAAGRSSALGIAVSTSARPPREAPFHALEVQPSITFTFGGIAIDTQARALDVDAEPVVGLFAAGADIGGVSNYGYAGGLAPAAITGRRAGAAAAAVG